MDIPKASPPSLIPVRKAWRKARRFAYTGHHFPFVYYSSCDTVFWPGCGLSGVYPAIVRRIVDILGGHLGADVGLTLDCCYDPVYQLGDVEAVAALRSIEERLKRRSISRVITGCVNCQKVLSQFLPGVTVEHVLEILPKDAFMPVSERHIYLHHPCQVFQFNSIGQQARELLGRKDERGISEAHEPMCCGYGGGLSALSPAQAGGLTKSIIEAAGENPIITYCTGCQDRLARHGKSSSHILELLRGIEPGRKPVSKSRRWVNRLLMSLSQRI